MDEEEQWRWEQWWEARTKVLAAFLVLTLLVAGLAGGMWWVRQDLLRRNQEEVWRGEALFLVRLHHDFQVVSWATESYLASENSSWSTVAHQTQIALGRLRGDYGSGSPTFAALNITSGILIKGSLAYVTVENRVLGDPDLLSNGTAISEYLVRAGQLFDRVGRLLDPIQPDGTDPLTQLGPEAVSNVANAMAELCVLHSEFEHFTPC